MENIDIERILNEANQQLIILVCKNNDKIACELIPACDRFMKVSGFCDCGMDASFIYNHRDLCRECLKNEKSLIN